MLHKTKKHKKERKKSVHTVQYTVHSMQRILYYTCTCSVYGIHCTVYESPTRPKRPLCVGKHLHPLTVPSRSFTPLPYIDKMRFDAACDAGPDAPWAVAHIPMCTVVLHLWVDHHRDDTQREMRRGYKSQKAVIHNSLYRTLPPTEPPGDTSEDKAPVLTEKRTAHVAAGSQRHPRRGGRAARVRGIETAFVLLSDAT